MLRGEKLEHHSGMARRKPCTRSISFVKGGNKRNGIRHGIKRMVAKRRKISGAWRRGGDDVAGISINEESSGNNGNLL